MNKERKAIESNAIVVFDGDVDASELNELFQDFQGDIIINGSIISTGKELSIKCNNLYIMEKLICSHVIVEGSLHVEDVMDCCYIGINGYLSCMYSIDSFEINVTEDLYVKESIYTNGYDINVCGDLVCESDVNAAQIRVLGKFYVSDQVEADSISVG